MRGLRSYLIGCVILLLLYLTAEYYKPKPTNWAPTYLKEDKIPFGLYILHQEHESIFPKAQLKVSRLPAYNTLKDQKLKQTNYLLIAGNMNFDELDYKELVRFMEEGNHVFIAAFSVGLYLQDTLKLDIRSAMGYGSDKSVPINFVNPALKANKDYVFDKGMGEVYFDKIDTSRATVLGKNKDGKANFVKYSFGKGALFLLPNPKILTNYSLLNPKGAEYAAKALSYLPAGHTLIWDEHNTRGNKDSETELRVLFKNTPLRWAYYLSVFGLLAFVFFEIKRRQRIIPVIGPLKNTSVDFVKVVGKVYYQQRDNRDIAQKKISYFLEFIRTNYRVKTSNIDEELIKEVVLRSGVSDDTVRSLFEVIQEMDSRNQVHDTYLIKLNKLIEKFYKQAQ